MLANEALEQHRREHKNQKRFLGFSTKRHVETIADLVAMHQPSTLLDFGCGKGMQYLKTRVHDDWMGILPACYDPCVPALTELPEGIFGGVICIDVLEHIGEDAIDETLETIFSKADLFIFLSISISESRKTLSNGKNCHVTIKDPQWWDSKIELLKLKYDKIDVTVKYMDY